MMTRKNLYSWERMVRLLVGIIVVIWAVLGLTDPVWQVIAAACGVTLIVTAGFGFCPMCAIAGRQIKSTR